MFSRAIANAGEWKQDQHLGGGGKGGDGLTFELLAATPCPGKAVTADQKDS
jgi:hypothetical protein